jgi:hypothetical protein
VSPSVTCARVAARTGNGPRRRPLVRYLRGDVLAWGSARALSLPVERSPDGSSPPAAAAVVCPPASRTGWVQRPTGTSDKPRVQAIERMLVALGQAGKRDWELLDAVLVGQLPLAGLYDAWRVDDLEGLRQRLRAFAAPAFAVANDGARP